jgi:uracil DNA glycosylase
LKARSIACVIETGHPSSRNSRIGDFMNSDVFKRINEFRTNLDLSQIIW